MGVLFYFMKWHSGKKVELNNSAQIACYRQVLGKETKATKDKTKREIAALEHKLNEKNTYLGMYNTQEEEESKKSPYVYDQATFDYDNKNTKYVAKAKRES